MTTIFRSSVSVLALCTLATTLQAQDLIVLDDVIVSASQTPTEANKTGATVDVLTEEQIQEGGSQRLTDKIDQLPGISISSNGPVGARSGVFVRGLSQNYVSVYLNGIDLSDPSSTQTAFNWGGFLTPGIGRAEVLKGSQSAIYGSEAIAGVINFYTPTLDENGQEVRVQAEFGSYDTFSTAFSYLQKTDRTDLSFTLSHYKTDGFSSLDENDGWVEADDYENTTLLVSVDHQATDLLRFGATLLYQDEYLNIDGFGDGNADKPFYTERTGARVYGTFETGIVEHTLSLAYTLTERRDPTGFTQSFDGERTEVEYSGKVEMANSTHTFGVSHSKEESLIDGAQNDFTIVSLWTESLFELGPDVDLSLASRYEDHSEFGGASTGRIAVAWRASAATTVRASLGTGFRAPSLNELFGPFGSNANLEPEQSRSFDLGVSHAFASGAEVDATLFYTEIDDLIIYTTAYSQVPGTTVSKGVELSGSMQLGQSLLLFGGYTYTDARDQNGAQQRRVPRNQFVLGIEGDITDRISGELVIQHNADRVDPGPVPDYTLVNAQVTYGITETSEAYLRVENLLDEEYQTANTYGTSDRAAFFGIRASF